MHLKYRKVKMNEAGQVFSMLKESAEWLRAKEIDYWQDWHKPQEKYREWIMEGIRKREFYFALDDDMIVSIFRLKYEDELFWGKRTDRAGYIHSFTTKRTCQGKGIGRLIFNDIEDMLYEKGAAFLRLDCGAKIDGLCKYYEKYGFEPKGEISMHGETLKLYEKKISK